jgi:hypothetical protein
MNHVTEGQLQAYLDGEAVWSDGGRVQEHLRLCGECAAELAELRALNEVAASALSAIDVAAPAALPAWRQVQRRAAARPRGLTVGRRALSRAAILLIAAAGVATAALPGSPVRRWIAEAVERMAGVLAPEQQPAVEPVLPIGTGQQAGISVAPSQGRVRVVLVAPAEGARVRVVLVDGSRATVWADEAAGARFSSTPGGRVEAHGVSGGEVVVELPRGALVATVEIDGEVVVTKEADALVARGVRVQESAAQEIVFRVGG